MFQTTITLTGNIVTDLKRGHTVKGDEWVNFRMAANERRYDKATDSWGNGDSLYIRVTCWRKLAFGVSHAVGKGDPVIVTGRVYTNDYVTKEGEQRSEIQLEAYNVGIDLSRCNARIDRMVAAPAAEVDGPEEESAPDDARSLIEHGELAAA